MDFLYFCPLINTQELMKKQSIFVCLLLMAAGGVAQEKKYSYKFYGQIRTDLYYNSRANEETVDGLFYMYPKDKSYDADGKDLNATANGSFYTLFSRLGVDVKGPRLRSATVSAKIELDFRGSGTTYSIGRIRHAYLNLDWKKSALLLGQTWHPLYGDVTPQILNLNMGAPFQPLSRAPQIRYRYTVGEMLFTAATLWQSQFLSQGPDGKSQEYIKKSCIPEIYVSADYKNSNWLAGVGMEVVSLKPRTQSTVDGQVYKVNERETSLSYEIHVKYTSSQWYVAAKSVLGSNLTQVSMLGGYGIKSVDARTGKQTYSPNRNTSSWLNIVYGNTWKPAVFFGYMKNLGTGDAVTAMYGTGTNVDQLVNAGVELTYNVPHWKFGLEYNFCSAWYGSLNSINGKVVDTHSVSNNRLVATVLFTF